MSNKYKHGDRVPSNVLAQRLDELAEAVTKGNLHQFVMRVPAELDRDADLVLSQAAGRLLELSEVKLLLRNYKHIVNELALLNPDNTDAVIDLQDSIELTLKRNADCRD